MMTIASGMVVNPPTRARANPAAFIASLLRRLEINMPMPAPSATRVPVQRIISGNVMFLSIIANSSVKIMVWLLDASMGIKVFSSFHHQAVTRVELRRHQDQSSLPAGPFELRQSGSGGGDRCDAREWG